MKMSQKLMILFSLLAALMTIANSVYSYQTRIEDLNESTYENLTALGNKMRGETEQYVLLMDFALDELVGNVNFMNSLHAVHTQEDTEDIGEFMAAQTLMSHTLYQSSIFENFHRVSVYSRNGFFLSNKFEKTDTVVNLSDEARETVASLPYLDSVDQNPFQRHLVIPHTDPWSASRGDPVFCAVKAAIWHGQLIGYLEVAAHTDELDGIFCIREVDGLLAQAVFDDGRQLYRAPGDGVCYTGLNPSGMTRYALEDGSERLVVALHSKTLGLTIYVSQDMQIYSRRAQELLARYVMVACLILLIALIFIAVSSLGLTRSIRRLSKKMKHLPVDNLMAHPEEGLTTMVTSLRDQDIYHLEEVFNDLITRLQRSHREEVSMREGTLQAQLSALQMQINPHFIYNTLNIISAKGMESGNEEIIEICSQFAQMLRYATDLQSKTATLEDELQNARRYLLLLKARYEERLSFTIDAPAFISALLIPKLTLQPIIENAVSHGFANQSGILEITVTGTVRDGQLILVIRDNGYGFDKDVLSRLTQAFVAIDAKSDFPEVNSNGHIGLINTYLRLHYYSKGKIRMRIYNDCGAVVELTLPCTKEE